MGMGMGMGRGRGRGRGREKVHNPVRHVKKPDLYRGTWQFFFFIFYLDIICLLKTLKRGKEEEAFCFPFPVKKK